MELNSLRSGLIGAIVGEILTLVGSIWAIGLTAKNASVLAETERRDRERKSRKASIQAILAEIGDNLELATELITQNTLVPFLTDMWEAHKGTVAFLSSDKYRYVRKGCAAAAMANAMALGDLDQLKYRDGYLKSEYDERARQMVIDLQESESALRKYCARSS